MSYKILKIDPFLAKFEDDINLRMNCYKAKRKELVGEDGDLSSFANGHKYFGIHPTEKGWIYREWAPAAEQMFFTGEFNNWDVYGCPMKNIGSGIWEVELEGKETLKKGQRIQAVVIHNGQTLRRIPTYATRVVQDPQTITWCAVVDDVMDDGFEWTDEKFKPAATPYIYECHIGMSQEEGCVGTYRQFKENVLPRIKDLGYNTIQIMAIMEHPYYGSFGYQVSNFFAASSRYGDAKDLKDLINTAHKMGITVLLDVVHSHAVKNTNEGLNQFDGTEYQFFHEGGKGDHSAWGTKCFNYGKNEVIHFLLSNLKFWMETFHFDGFRFDGVTSMLYLDHGLGSAFSGYDMYFSMNTDLEAVTYLQLANELIHQVNPKAMTIAEDMSGMPGMCIKIEDGGIGFDFRLSMGIPDLWIKMIKESKDEDWDIDKLWVELSGRRPKEKTVGYAESHDQALVGDKTIMFRLCDAEMYTSMRKDSGSMTVDRGVALHKMIRLITSTLAGEGYLNFMGNEFGHPEWIDFPREGNGWSYHYCRRQWSLAENPELRYEYLREFDKSMIAFLKKERIMIKKADCHYIHNSDKIMIYSKGKDVFVFNFHPSRSFDSHWVSVPEVGEYQVVISTDESRFGGFDRVDKNYVYTAVDNGGTRPGFHCYLPNRTGIVFKKIDK